MDENIDAGRLNRRFLHLWLAVSLWRPGPECDRQRPAGNGVPSPALPLLAPGGLGPVSDRAAGLTTGGAARRV